MPTDLVVGPWGARFRGRSLPCSIGRGGMTPGKREGDGATPIATMQIVATLYRADRIARPAPWAQPIGPRDLWADDPKSPSYNHLVQAPFSASHERMRRADPLYDLVLVTDWNWPDAVPGCGSAIFVHRWRKPRHPTEGCAAFAPDVLEWIASQAEPGTRLITRA